MIKLLEQFYDPDLPERGRSQEAVQEGHAAQNVLPGTEHSYIFLHLKCLKRHRGDKDELIQFPMSTCSQSTMPLSGF